MEAGPELDALVATKVMEWQVLTLEQEDSTDDVSDRVCLLTPRGLMRYYEQPHGLWLFRPWQPSADHNVVALVRAEIGRRELGRRFIIELYAIVSGLEGGEVVTPNDYVWALLNASPAQQCRAALKAVGVDTQPETAPQPAPAGP